MPEANVSGLVCNGDDDQNDQTKEHERMKRNDVTLWVGSHKLTLTHTHTHTQIKETARIKNNFIKKRIASVLPMKF